MDCSEGVVFQRNSGASLRYEKEEKMREVSGRKVRGANLYVSPAYERPPHAQLGTGQVATIRGNGHLTSRCLQSHKDKTS